MRKAFFLTIIFAVLILSIQAQTPNYSSSRLDNLANQLKRQTVDLADITFQDLKRDFTNNRREIETAFLAQQLDASAGLFQQLVSNNRSASELRDAASILTDLARRAPNFGSNRNLWRNTQNAVNDINRELGGSNDGGDSGDSGNQITGRAFWRGRVDKEVRLIIKNRNIETQLISGNPNPPGTFSFADPLPTRNVKVEVNKKEGRGKVRVLQQPNRNNDYTAIIQIYDEGGGARDYQLEIFWQ